MPDDILEWLDASATKPLEKRAAVEKPADQPADANDAKPPGPLSVVCSPETIAK
jgi:hypothetical protein